MNVFLQVFDCGFLKVPSSKGRRQIRQFLNERLDVIVRQSLIRLQDLVHVGLQLIFEKIQRVLGNWSPILKKSLHSVGFQKSLFKFLRACAGLHIC